MCHSWPAGRRYVLVSDGGVRKPRLETRSSGRFLGTSDEAFVSPGERQIPRARLYSTAGVRATDDDLAVHSPRERCIARRRPKRRLRPRLCPLPSPL